MKKTKQSSKKEEGFTRIEAFASAILSKKEGKIKALIALANQKYVAKGGKNNLNESGFVTIRGIQILAAMKLVTIDGDSYKLL